jgi:hypothetical protein
MRTFITLVLISACAATAPAAQTNWPAYKEPESKPERAAEHQKAKIIVKVKGKNGSWKTEREFPLMFSNNRKADKPKKK